ncbi:MAG: hypothetical protein KJ623_04780 [Nanoarchaeota archaeon]|nr:hypothetical protein [Nanoarchaeota archaeon]MBU0963335.1 hypothetical protein [Nanoarchaeota archaeon]
MKNQLYLSLVTEDGGISIFASTDQIDNHIGRFKVQNLISSEKTPRQALKDIEQLIIESGHELKILYDNLKGRPLDDKPEHIRDPRYLFIKLDKEDRLLSGKIFEIFIKYNTEHQGFYSA